VNMVAPISGSPSVCIGYSTLFTDATPGGTWSSGAPLIASVGSASGSVTGASSGTTNIIYTSPAGCQAVQAISVNSGPAPITGVTHVCMALSTALSDVSTGGSWSSASPTIASAGSSTGIVSGIASGTAVISYSLGSGCYTTTVVTVNPRPLAITGTTALCVGATSILADGSGSGTWSSSSTGIAGIGSLTGLLTGASAGSATVTYTLPTGCFGTKPVTINPLPGAISGPFNVCAGQAITLTDTTTGGTWSSSSLPTATIGSSTGVVIGVAGGVTNITYSLPTGCITSRAVTVNAIPSVITGTATVCVGHSTTLADAALGGSWSSSATGIATVGSFSGVVTGVAGGTAVITYMQAAGCYVTRTVTVYALPASITGTSSACVGQTTTLGDTTIGGIWSSGNAFIATVGSSTGIVSGVASGSAVISYSTSVGCAATYPVTVNPLPPAITGGSSVCAAATLPLADPGSGTWTSGATGIATVSSSGLVTGVAGGSAIISFTAATGCSATHVVSVTAVPAITGLHNLCAWGDTVSVHNANGTGAYSCSLVTVANLGAGNGRVTANAPGVATIYYTIPLGCYTSTTLTVNSLPGAITGLTHICVGTGVMLGNPIPGGTWSSSSTSVATIGSLSGIISGVSSGTAYITYTTPAGCSTDTPIHVNPIPSMIVGYPTVIVTTSVPYTDATTGGAWSSSDPAVATIGATSGVFYGASSGVVTISYTMGTGCAATKSVTVHILGGVSPGGSQELIGSGDIRVIPNPSKGTFAIIGTIGPLKEEDEVFIELSNMLGQPVYKNKVITHSGEIEEQVNLGNGIANGMYLLTVRSSGENKVMHLVISR
jgi:trimeric autotransporter adhesin